MPMSVQERQGRLDALVERTRRLVGADALDGSPTVEDCLAALRAHLEHGGGGEDAALLALDLHALHDEGRTAVYLRRMTAVSELQKGLAQLRAVTSVEEAIRRGPEVACRSCGFQAAVLVQLDEGSKVVPVSAWSERDPRWFPKVRRRLMNADGSWFDIADLSLEREMIRRRMPFLAEDAMNDDRPGQELRRMTGVRSYVAAPILPEDRIIAFMYAITFDGPLDVVDRDLLWAFTEGYGYALERTILRSRVDQQAKLVAELVRSTERQMDAIGTAGLKLVEPEPDALARRPDPRPQFARFVSTTSPVHAALTRRELEVMELLAEGATNRVIAERLIVAESTAKAHVAQILKKLGARNRAEAVNRYLQMLQAP